MHRCYTVEFENVAVTEPVDFFEILAATDHPIEVYGLFLSQATEAGDAQDEQIRIRAIRGHTTGGSGGARPTPVPCDDGDQAARFTAETCNTTIASEGTPVNPHSDGFNVRAGLPLWLPEGSTWWTRGTSLLVVRLMGRPADSISFSGTLYVREY